MNGAASTLEDDLISAGKRLPRILDAVPLEERTICVTFEDGCSKVVDLAPVLASRPCYIRLRTDDSYFRAFTISEFRDAIEWKDDLDLSAVWIETLPPVT